MNVFKNISVLLSKNMFFLKKLRTISKILRFTQTQKLKETMSRKESKFCVINFIDSEIIFLKRKFKHHVQCRRIFRYRIKKVNWKEGDMF